MKSYKQFLPVIIAAAITAGCSCGSQKEQPQAAVATGKVKDWKAYNLGSEHANRLLEQADNEAAVQDALLDVRARITNIETNIGHQAATDYERGFVEEIRAKNDSLAKIIF